MKEHLVVRFGVWMQMMAVCLLSLVSCKVDFSPNAAWQEYPVVYGILDQDDDTSYIRIQKCYLGEGDQYGYGNVFDSINYPAGSLRVVVLEWPAWQDENGLLQRTGAPVSDSLVFNYVLSSDKDSGSFFSEAQPLYVCRTAGLLDSSCLYQLVVTKVSSGDTLCTAETALIGGNMRLHTPNNTTRFLFSGSGRKTCDIQWSTVDRGRRYMPMVRFRYRDFIIEGLDTTITYHHIDIPCGTVLSSMTSQSEGISLGESLFLNTIKDQLKDYVVNRNPVDTVDIYIKVCSEDLSAYIYSAAQSSSSTPSLYSYSNINKGLGVFASRRTHIMFHVKAPGEAASQYRKNLKELNVGF